jgi:hypothetical protein
MPILQGFVPVRETRFTVRVRPTITIAGLRLLLRWSPTAPALRHARRRGIQ